MERNNFSITANSKTINGSKLSLTAAASSDIPITEVVGSGF